jgi:hypothetical protein
MPVAIEGLSEVKYRYFQDKLSVHNVAVVLVSITVVFASTFVDRISQSSSRLINEYF